jgi:hypothetical protein
LYLNTEGFNLTVFRKPAGFGVRVVNRANGREQVGTRTYESEAEARDATHRGLVWAKQKLQM